MKSIQLSRDEALVLFEWLSKTDPRDSHAVPVDDVEATALDGLQCALEKELIEPFENNYLELVCAARERLEDNKS